VGRQTKLESFAEWVSEAGWLVAAVQAQLELKAGSPGNGGED
jgi:hypothetical protein